MRTILLLATLLAVAACKQAPPGSCGNHLDCFAGQECSGGVCTTLDTDHQVGSRCVRDADCVAWADCDGGLCATSPGMCADGAECAPWQWCTSHVCTTSPGFCGGESECAAWQDCGNDHRCALTPGMCGTGADCAGWQICGTDHVCALATNGCADDAGCASWQDCVSYRCATSPGFCAGNADCQSWEGCGAAHTCAVAQGRCLADADCASWQTCDVPAHACVAAPGRCDSAGDCQAWETCGATHDCALAPGRCVLKADCATGQLCEDHDCVADPCASLPPICSGTTSGFSMTGQSGSIAAGAHQGTHFDSSFSGRLAVGFPDPSTNSNRQTTGVDVRDASGAWWAFSFGAALLDPGKYAVTGYPNPNFMYVGPDLGTCFEPGGHFAICEIEVAHEPWTNWDAPPTLGVTAAFHQTCLPDGTGPAVDGCVRFILGSQPGQFGPPRQLEGSGWSVCATGTGLLRCWGNRAGESGPTLVAPDAVSAVGVGVYHVCAVFAGGEVRCWGRNWEGQSGNGTDTSDVKRPLTVIPSGAVDVFAGYGASYALMDDGRMVYWGKDPTAPRSDVPADRFPTDTFVFVSAEYDFACGVTPAGGVKCWGSNAEGQLGIGRQYPVPGNTVSAVPLDVVGLPGPVVRLDTGEKTVCAVIDSGALYCWGRNQERQVGIGTTDLTVLTPTPLAGLDVGVTDVAVGGNHACAIVAGGVTCWGQNFGGRVGDGSPDYTLASSPVWVTGMEIGRGAVQIAATWFGSCARLGDETVWCWGADIAGDGVQNDELVPVQVTRW